MRIKFEHWLILVLFLAFIIVYVVSSKSVVILSDETVICTTTHSPDVSSLLKELKIKIEEDDKLNIPLDHKLQDGEVIRIEKAKDTIVEIDSKTVAFKSPEENVNELLKDRGIEISKNDRVVAKNRIEFSHFPRLISIVRVIEDIAVEKRIIPYELVYQPHKSVEKGKVVTLKYGTGGVKEYIYKLRYENGKLVSKQLIEEKVLIPPESHLYAVGEAIYRGGAVKEFYMEATAYTPTVEETDSDPWTTASGMRSGYGVVAVDPKVIPLGNKLYIEGYGYAIAGDTGGAIKGMRIDVFFYDKQEMYKWGRRWVKVYLLP